jgi:hypothetical protein
MSNSKQGIKNAEPNCPGSLFLVTVRVEGLEPPCLAASDPKSDTSTNFATPAFPVSVSENFDWGCKSKGIDLIIMH